MNCLSALNRRSQITAQDQPDASFECFKASVRIKPLDEQPAQIEHKEIKRVDAEPMPIPFSASPRPLAETLAALREEVAVLRTAHGSALGFGLPEIDERSPTMAWMPADFMSSPPPRQASATTRPLRCSWREWLLAENHGSSLGQTAVVNARPSC
ncbi:hypothetical protein [Sphingobium sp. AP50]|uniref:hypothetical protein n=1 Tax=Sphingobium sp. AP50 TaxID=1884369 RepID=UPI001160ABF5|nr:hypothetical protein [Sphingobium sp. AP50]